jgi:enamine deaminase RidA (YjgF/YER057c/UK114 family)
MGTSLPVPRRETACVSTYPGGTGNGVPVFRVPIRIAFVSNDTIRVYVPARHILALTLSLIFATLAAWFAEAAQHNKADKEPPSQTLPVLKDPPAAILADAARLSFHVSPLSAKGLLTQQTHDALQALLRANHGSPMVKLRAFVAGSGDARRVQAIVSEIFTDRKQPLPVLTTTQVGALPLEGAQIVIESISEEKKPQNPNGLAFVPAQHAEDAPAALEKLAAAAATANIAAADMLRVTCFLGSLDNAAPARLAASRVFPSAASDFVQRLRLSAGSSADCEGVGRRGSGGMNTPKLIFTGAQMAFGGLDSDLRLAFERLQKTLKSMGSSENNVIFSNLYPLSRAVEQKLPAPRNPASTLIVEGLPSPDASMAIEVVAAPQN